MSKFFAISIVLSTFFCFQAAAQVPENDDCTGATFLILDNNGNLCFTDTNTLATSDGIFTGCDANILPPLPPGGHELWYTFVTAGDSYTITATEGTTTPAERLAVVVMNGNCSSGAGVNNCSNAIFPGDPVSVTINSPPGTQVWFYVTALDFDGIFNVCITSENNPVTPGLDCNSAPILCNSNNFSSPGRTTINPSVTPSCFNTPLVSALWYRFTAGFSGPLEFSGFPNGAGGFRWALYDLTNGCPGTEIACNNVVNPALPFGLSATAANCINDPYCPPVNVVAGTSYALMVDDISLSGAGFDFSWNTNTIMMPNPMFTVDSIVACGSLTADFTNASAYTPATLWTFDYGDGTSQSGTGAAFNIPSHLYNTPGTYLATLSVSGPDGCNRSFSREIRIRPLPVASFTILNSPICFDGVSALGNFQANPVSNAATFQWNFQGSTLVNIPTPLTAEATWNAPGSYPVELVVNDRGCASEVSRDTIEIITSPQATLGMSNTGCTGSPVTVTYGGGVTPNAFFLWDFGGGGITNPGPGQLDLTWNSPGNYTVSLTLQDNGCTSAPLTQNIVIYDSPQITVSGPATVCEGATITIAPLATGAPANAQYTWDFGSATLLGGSTVDAGSATLNWPVSGNTFITGTATSIEGCVSAPDTVFISVAARPQPGFTLSRDTICENDTIVLNYSGTSPVAGSIFYWDFGTSTVLNPSTNAWGPYQLQPGSSGTNIIQLYMERNSCLSDTIVDTVIVVASPVADAGTNQTVCAGTVITTGAAAQPGYQYSWSPSAVFLNPNMATAQATILYYGVTDTTVLLSVTVENGGCTAYDTVAITLNPVQQAYFIPQDPQCEEGNSFNFEPYFGIIPGASFSWDINGTTYTTPVVSNFSFPSAGTYAISLQTQTPGCNMSAFNSEVRVKPTPQAAFTTDITSGCIPLTVNFQDLNAPLPGATYRWDMGNNVVSFDPAPLFTYTTAGLFTPSLTLTSADTCSSTTTGAVIIDAFGPASAVFTARPMIASENNPIITFSSLAATSGCFYDFGDNTTDTSCNPVHAYSAPGVYTVTLVTTSAGNCTDTFRLNVEIKSNYSIYLPSAFTPNDDGKNDQLEIYADGLENLDLKVFNARGQVVWETTDATETWNGRFQNTGEDCPSGIYVYEAMTRDINRKKHNLRGRISIIR